VVKHQRTEIVVPLRSQPTTAGTIPLTANSIEESAALTLDCNTLAKVAEVPGVLPCAVQNADTGEVIFVTYVNEPALARSIETRSAVFWSTSRNELWEKGKTSGKTFDLFSKKRQAAVRKVGYQASYSRCSMLARTPIKSKGDPLIRCCRVTAVASCRRAPGSPYCLPTSYSLVVVNLVPPKYQSSEEMSERKQNSSRG
jgi:phosphoribosyl-AMP cyclohydrolase